jgi:aldehyde dehydrogenase (NAD+)
LLESNNNYRHHGLSLGKYLSNRFLTIFSRFKIVESQRQFFKTNQTVPVNFRITQLQALKSMLSENQQKLTDAVYKDLRRVCKMFQISCWYLFVFQMQNQSYCLEIGGAIVEIDYMIDNLHGWTKPKPVIYIY